MKHFSHVLLRFVYRYTCIIKYFIWNKYLKQSKILYSFTIRVITKKLLNC